MIIRHGFTGTRKGMTLLQLEAVRALYRRARGMQGDHGDCTGADAQAHALMVESDFTIWIHPPLNPKNRARCISSGCIILPEREYMARNVDIVDDSHCLIATPGLMEEELRSGTWHAIRYARRIQRPIKIVWPDGSVTNERWSQYETWMSTP